MNDGIHKRVQALSTSMSGTLLQNGLKGLEKESLRVSADGHIASTPHPHALGSALTHPHITTDYSEALLEFITPPLADVRQTLEFLCDIHTFTYQHLDNEKLWATSMPCAMDDDAGVPIAWYGNSNRGMMKHVYRRGLGYRYGRIMQTISGIHFNYSLPTEIWPLLQEENHAAGALQDFISEQYFGLLRNFLRMSWLIPFLFGASPAICKSFLGGKPDGFREFDSHTWYEPYATSLRMSDIGYKNKHQAGLRIDYSGLDAYVASLTRAIETPEPAYSVIGVVVDDEYRQLNANLLQIENEFYSFIRPKNITLSGEKPTLALKRDGVKYVEVRALDVDAFDPLGTNEPTLRFLEAFLIYCLLHDSPMLDTALQDEILINQQRVTRHGRQPGLKLRYQGKNRLLRDWGMEICEQMQPVCEWLDTGGADNRYSLILKRQQSALENPDSTPSAKVLDEMRTHGESFFEFADRLSNRHERFFRHRLLDPGRQAKFVQLAAESHAEQKDIEAADVLAFETYLQNYFSQSA